MNIDRDSFMKVINRVNDGVYFVNPDRIITYWNDAAEKISGFSSGEVVGRSCSDNILTHVDSGGESLCLGNCPLEKTILDKVPRETEIFLHHKDGHRVPVSVRSAPLTDIDGNITGGVEVFTDLSNRSVNEQRLRELEKMAMVDKLTQIANRNYLEMELGRRMDEKKRYQASFGIFFMDVDHFKTFNDTYGHDVGDRVLTYIANTFLANSRSSDVYGRWGGEEFLGVIPAISLDDLTALGNRMRILVEKSYITHFGKNLHVTISIGGTIAGEDESVDDILKRADSYLYDCKSAGRNCVITG